MFKEVKICQWIEIFESKLKIVTVRDVENCLKMFKNV